MKTLAPFVALFVCLVCHPPAVAAQSHQGGVRGRVRDAGGVVPTASVQLTDERTNLSRTTISNAEGEYNFADVPPGTYRVRAAVTGYRTYERSGVVVGTQTFLAIDVMLEPGAVSESLTVTTAAPLLERSNGSVSARLDRSAIETRPSSGRNIFVMAATTPMVIPSGDSRFVRQQDQSGSSLISIAGGPRRDNSYTIDGVPIVDILNRASFIPSFQAVEEMRVQTSAYDVEIGRTSGGVFNTVGRSGSNVWRGNGMFQDRPSWAQSQSFFAAKNGIPNDPDSYYHLYGGSAGGPIVRNRTFFWASTEDYRSMTTRSTVLVLPTAAERRGDFSQAGFTIYDPLTTRPDPANPSQFIRSPFPNNQIPLNRLNPVAQALLQYLPMPTSGTSRPAVANLVDAADQVTAKLTERWSDRVFTTGLYAWYTSTEPDPRFFGEPVFQNAADPGGGALVRRVNMIALNNTWTPGSRTVVEARVGYNQFLDDNRPARFDPAGLGFAPAFLAAVPQQKFPAIGVAGYGSSSGFLGDRYQSTATYYGYDANVTVSNLFGRHALKLGADARVTGVRFLNIGGMGGYNFTSDFTVGPDPNAPAAKTGDSFATLLLGYPSSGAISVNAPIDVYLNYWSAYVQDDFRVTPKLTVNAGLRYEFEQGLQERDNRMAVGWADGGGLLYAGVGSAPTHQGDPNPWQFAPRAGAAYALDDLTVVRGGYGLFWAAAQGISADEFGSGTPGYNSSTNYIAAGANPFVPCATCSLTNPFPSGIASPVGNSLGLLTGIGGTIEFVDPRNHLAHFHRYSIDLQRELPHRIAAGIGYVGMLGRDLAGGISGAPLNVNQLDPKYLALGTALQASVPNPFFGTPAGVGILAGPSVSRGQLLRPYPQFDAVYMTRASLSRSRYDALVMTVDRRMADRWSAQVNYTWSRAQDSQFSESNFFAGGSAILDNYDVDREYALSALDAPHRLNISATWQLPLGLMVSAVGTYQSGFPVTVNQAANNSNLLGSNQRPNVVAGVDPRLNSDLEDSYDAGCGCVRWLNPAAWSQAAPFTFGSAPRTDGRVRTPMRRNWDLAVQKSQRVGRTTIAIKAELINVLNAVDFLGPDISFGGATFGQIRSAAGFPRMLQLSAQAGW